MQFAASVSRDDQPLAAFPVVAAARLLFGGSATCTASPSAMPSGGLWITRSSAARPEPISIVWPRSRAIVTCFSVTLLSLSSVATRRPFLSNSSALDGMRSAAALLGKLQADVGETARQQLAVRVVDAELHQRAAR